VAGEREFQPDPEGGAGQGRDDGLGAFQGLGVHPRAFDLAEHLVHLHDAVEDRLGSARAHLGDDVQVHPAGEVLLAAGDDDALDACIRQRLSTRSLRRANASVDITFIDLDFTSQVIVATPSASVVMMKSVMG
jgi:hypothetical protein